MGHGIATELGLRAFAHKVPLGISITLRDLIWSVLSDLVAMSTEPCQATLDATHGICSHHGSTFEDVAPDVLGPVLYWIDERAVGIIRIRWEPPFCDSLGHIEWPVAVSVFHRLNNSSINQCVVGLDGSVTHTDTDFLAGLLVDLVGHRGG